MLTHTFLHTHCECNATKIGPVFAEPVFLSSAPPRLVTLGRECISRVWCDTMETGSFQAPAVSLGKQASFVLKKAFSKCKGIFPKLDRKHPVLFQRLRLCFVFLKSSTLVYLKITGHLYIDWILENCSFGIPTSLPKS